MENKKKFILLFVLVTVLAFILRFYDLGKVPMGLYQDETAIGYNAYSILKTGKDEYGKPYPLYFKSFGDQKLPVYIYATVPSVAIFGLTPFAVRFPSALFGALSVPLFGLLVLELTRSKKLSILSMSLLAITPWHLHYNRATFEVSISLFLFILGTLLIHKALSSSKTKGFFLLGTVSFVIALYTYNLTRLLAPVLFALTIIFFRKKLTNVSKLELGLSALVGILLLAPFVLTLFTSGGGSSASGTLIFSSAVVQAPLLELRSYLADSNVPFASLFFNKYVLTGFEYIKNIFSYASIDFFFIHGSSHGNHGIGNVGQFYLFELPFMIWGLICIFRKKLSYGYFLILWSILTVAVCALTRDIPHATRSFFLLVPLTVMAGLGILDSLSYVHKIKLNYIKYGIIIFVGIFTVYNIIYYFASYYFVFPVKYAKQWSAADQELNNYLKDNSDKYKTIIVDKNTGLKYTSILFYTAYPPSEFQNTVKRAPDDSEGFSEVNSFGKYTFKDVDWTKDYQNPNTLIITIPTDKPNEVPPLKAYYYPTKPVVIPKGQEILQYPIAEIPYVLVETK